jgi:hypothetical protein
MRIGITGSHWVWKSSLLNSIDWNKIQEIARKLIKEKWNPKYMTKYELEEFQETLLIKQIRAELWKDSFIIDRTVFDILAYSQWLYNYKELKKRVIKYLGNFPYHKVIYIPIEFELEDDWIRFEDKEYQKEIDKRILNLLKEFNIPYKTISWTLQERINLFNNL